MAARLPVVNFMLYTPLLPGAISPPDAYVHPE